MNTSPNSILGKATPEERELIRRGRKQAEADQKAIESWARNGFAAGFEQDESSWYEST